MKILILGGTGAMGTPLVQILQTQHHNLFVTSRKPRNSTENVTFLEGDAHEQGFLDTLLRENYDAIVDFMIYTTQEFQNKLPLFLDHTAQYFFFSSSRVYAESKIPLTENSPRLLDVCQDKAYLATDEYALAKAREENLLYDSGRKNWTIIRPYITYNSHRLQLGVYEKEQWLYRALHGRRVVIPRDLANHITTLTAGNDVAAALSFLIGNEKTFGESYHITTDESISWLNVLRIYQENFREITGKEMNVSFIKDTRSLQKVSNPAQIRFDRLYDRRFDHRKLMELLPASFCFQSVSEGLKSCMKLFFTGGVLIGFTRNGVMRAGLINMRRTGHL